MKQEETTGAGQAAAFTAGVIMFLFGLGSAWESLHTGIYVFRYARVVHTGTFAQYLMMTFLLVGWFLMTTAWKRLR
jgi:hypothetical protein